MVILRVRASVLAPSRHLQFIGTSQAGHFLKEIIQFYSPENFCDSVPKATCTLYRTVKRSVAESVPYRASVHTRNFAFEAVSAQE